MAILERELQRLGVVILHDDRYARIERLAGDPAARRVPDRRRETCSRPTCCSTASAATATPTTSASSTIGIAPGQYGLLEVNEHYQTVHPHIYAVGDVIGYPALASTSMEQGRQAMRHAFGIPGPEARHRGAAVRRLLDPRGRLHRRHRGDARWSGGVDYVVGRGDYDMNPRAQILGDIGRAAQAAFRAASLKLLGAHIVGTSASELVHIGEAFLRQGATAPQIAETIYNYPTLSDLYRHAALKALAEDRRRKQSAP